MDIVNFSSKIDIFYIIYETYEETMRRIGYEDNHL